MEMAWNLKIIYVWRGDSFEPNLHVFGVKPSRMVNWHPVTEPFGIQTGRSRYIYIIYKFFITHSIHVWYIYLQNQMSTWDAVGNLGMNFCWESIFSTNPNCSTRLETSFRVALAFPLWLSPPAAAFSCFEKALGQADGCRFPPEVSEFGVATKFVESSLESAERIRPPKQAGRTWRIILGRT